jgi:DNA repair exonuclease SbcCD ATPase subunit
MKYLKKYEIFLEDFIVNDTDSPDLKMAKEKMNTMKSHLSEYKTKKSLIDKLYSNMDLKNEDIESELKNILGDKDAQNGPDRNPFLVEYAHLSKLDRDINKLQDDNSNDKIKIDDLQQSLSLTEGDDTKKAVQFKISDIKNRMSERSSKISQIKKDLSDKEKEHKDKMSKLEGDMKEYIQKISLIFSSEKIARFLVNYSFELNTISRMKTP